MECCLNIVCVADIFGLTEEFKQLAQHVLLSVEKKLGFECQGHLLGPYQKQPESFHSETQAYQYFTSKTSIISYESSLEETLSRLSEHTIIVGFSVGGSALWQLLSRIEVKPCIGAICFYSSQIRHMTQLTPNIPTRLILPRTEQHFSITQLINKLTNKPNIILEKSQYLHGFMNALSSNYDPVAYQHYIDKLANEISQQFNAQKL